MHIHEVYGHACNLFVLPMYSTHPACSSKANERVNEQTEPGRTNERTNEPTWTNERNGTGNQRICNTAQPYEPTAVPLPVPTLLMMKQKKPHPSERHVSVSRPLLGGTPFAYRLRLP